MVHLPKIHISRPAFCRVYAIRFRLPDYQANRTRCVHSPIDVPFVFCSAGQLLNQTTRSAAPHRGSRLEKQTIVHSGGRHIFD